MKISALAFISTLATTGAFSVLPNTAVPRTTTGIQAADKPFFAEEEETAVSMTPTVYDRLGFAEDEIAIGVNANEVLQWLGNRDDIIAKFQKDNKGMDEERVIVEVDKFMMDREMVQSFVAFEKRKADPRNLKEEAVSNLSDPSTWGVYAVWIAGGAGFAYVKNVIIEPKYASGEWEEIHITLPGADRFAQTAVDVADAAASSM